MPFSLDELEPGGFKGQTLLFSMNISRLEHSLLTDCGGEGQQQSPPRDASGHSDLRTVNR